MLGGAECRRSLLLEVLKRTREDQSCHHQAIRAEEDEKVAAFVAAPQADDQAIDRKADQAQREHEQRRQSDCRELCAQVSAREHVSSGLPAFTGGFGGAEPPRTRRAYIGPSREALLEE